MPKVRMQQRCITLMDIDSVLDFGRFYYRPGRQAEVVFLAERNLSYRLKRIPSVRRAVGIAVLLTGESVLTVYRTRKLKRILRGRRWSRNVPTPEAA